MLARIAWVLALAIFAILLAYPLGGALYFLIDIAWGAQHADANFIVFWLMFFVFATIDGSGFIPSLGHGPDLNLYPWIIPTAVALFLIFAGIWLWFSRKS